MIYLVFYTISLTIYWIALSRNRWGKILLMAFVVLISSLFAGLRNEDVGADTVGYVLGIWQMAGYYRNITDFLLDADREIGYVVLNFLLNKISSDFHFFLFIHQLIIITVVILASLRLNDKKSSFLLLISYYLYLYKFMLSGARQGLALAFVIYAITFLLNSKYKFFYLFCLIGTLFHNSVIFAILLPILKYLAEKFQTNIKRLFIISICTLFILVTYFRTILSNAINGGIVAEHYIHYLNQEGFRSHKANIVLVLGFFVVSIYNQKRKENRSTYYYTINLLIWSLAFLLMGDMIETANRVVFYLSMASIMSAPLCSTSDRNKKKIVLGYSLMLVLYALFYTIYYPMEYHSVYWGI